MSDEPKQMEAAGWGVLDELPGNPLMWVLIISELLVFGAFFAGFSADRVLHPMQFASSQARLDRLAGGINTMLLLTSGLFAALGSRARMLDNIRSCRRWLAAQPSKNQQRVLPAWYSA